MILIDATPLQAEHRYRGVGTYTRHLAENLVALEPHAFCFAAARNDPSALLPSIRDRAIFGRRGHRPAQVYWLYNEFFLRRIISHTRPSVFHATDFNGLVVHDPVRTVATLHDLTPLKVGLDGSGLSERLSDLRWRVYFQRKLPRASHIIAVSRQVREDAMHLLGLPGERISVIPEGVDLEGFRPGRGRGRYAHEPAYFLHVGSRAPNKNTDRILQAFAAVARHFSHVSLYLAGQWSEEDRVWLDKECFRLDVSRTVRYLGFVTPEDLPSLYANALALVFPSLQEGFGLPVLEAMASGTPVLTSWDGSLADVAGSAALLVDPTDSHHIAAGMSDLLHWPELRDALIVQGLARARAFSWTQVARRTFDVYRSLC